MPQSLRADPKWCLFRHRSHSATCCKCASGRGDTIKIGWIKHRICHSCSKTYNIVIEEENE